MGAEHLNRCERSRVVWMLVALALVVRALSVGVLGASHRPKLICVQLGSKPLSHADTRDLANEFHLPKDEIAAFEECADRGWNS